MKRKTDKSKMKPCPGTLGRTPCPENRKTKGGKLCKACARYMLAHWTDPES